jgi:hypothetical protein
VRFLVTVEDPNPVAVALQVRDLLRCVSRTNRWLMTTQRIPPLYESGIVFRAEPWGDKVQHAANCAEALERGWADCKVLCAYLHAQRLLENPKVDPERFDFKIYWRVFDKDPLHASLPGAGQAQTRIYHVQLRLPDGSLEDPSRMLHR